MTTIEKFCEKLGLEVKDFMTTEDATKRIGDLETAIDILLSGAVNDGE